jgi:hypothetical protein
MAESNAPPGVGSGKGAQRFLAVGSGASAGELEVIQEFFSTIPAIQNLLGHNSIRTTQQYGRVSNLK